MITVIGLLIAHWFLSLFFQTFFLHRYSSHPLFKMPKFWEKTFYFLTWATQGPSFLNPRAYSIMHQRHHHFSDKEGDPHSPHQSPNFIEMMKHTYKEYQSLLEDEDKEIPHFINKSYPQWKSIDNFSKTGYNVYFWIFIYFMAYIALSVPWYLFPAIAIHSFMGPIQGAIVNWCGHYIGYRNFDTQDKSRNTLFLDIPLMGELYQNNHHKNCQKINFAKRWFEIDVTYYLSLMLNRLGIIQIRETSL